MYKRIHKRGGKHGMYKEVDEQKDKSEMILSVEEQEKLQRDRLTEVLSLLVLDNGCIHSYLENYMRSPAEASDLGNEKGKCIKSCFSCCKDVQNYIIPICQRETRKFLSRCFIQNGNINITPLELANKIGEYDNYQTAIYGKKKEKDVCKYHTEGTVMQLIASGILTLQVINVKIDGTNTQQIVVCRLTIIDDVMPAFLENDRWKRISHF